MSHAAHALAVELHDDVAGHQAGARCRAVLRAPPRRAHRPPVPAWPWRSRRSFSSRTDTPISLPPPWSTSSRISSASSRPPPAPRRAGVAASNPCHQCGDPRRRPRISFALPTSSIRLRGSDPAPRTVQARVAERAASARLHFASYVSDEEARQKVGIIGSMPKTTGRRGFSSGSSGRRSSSCASSSPIFSARRRTSRCPTGSSRRRSTATSCSTARPSRGSFESKSRTCTSSPTSARFRCCPGRTRDRSASGASSATSPTRTGRRSPGARALR